MTDVLQIKGLRAEAPFAVGKIQYIRIHISVMQTGSSVFVTEHVFT